jgi:hypothetical protein
MSWRNKVGAPSSGKNANQGRFLLHDSARAASDSACACQKLNTERPAETPAAAEAAHLPSRNLTGEAQNENNARCCQVTRLLHARTTLFFQIIYVHLRTRRVQCIVRPSRSSPSRHAWVIMNSIAHLFCESVCVCVQTLAVFKLISTHTNTLSHIDARGPTLAQRARYRASGALFCLLLSTQDHIQAVWWSLRVTKWYLNDTNLTC